MIWRGLLVFTFTLTAQAATAQNAMAQDAPFEAATVRDFPRHLRQRCFAVCV